VGTDATGTRAVPNLDDGVVISSGSHNTIGGTSPAARNVISGNGFEGVNIVNSPASGNLVQGDFIGTDVTGTSPVPNGRNGVTIDVGAAGTTVGGAAGAGNVISANASLGVAIFGSASNTVQGNLIGLDSTGAAALGNQLGVFIINAPNNLVGGAAPGEGNVIAANANTGINILGNGTTGTVVQGNFIGTDVTGHLPRGNGSFGIFIFDASQNLIGGPSVADRNVISANGGHGIGIAGTSATANRVQGNYIGTDISGSTALGNGAIGVAIGGVPGNVVGGTDPGAGNLISGNLGGGVAVDGTGGIGNFVQGNLIGTDASGMRPVPNGGNGVTIDGGASQNIIGGTDASASNTIAYNNFGGVVVRSGTGDAIRGNSIFSNGGLGIDLGADGVTPNDRGDGDAGPNNLQNYPVITSAIATPVQLVVVGSIDTANPKSVTIEIYASSVPVPGADPTGHGEGQTFLGKANPDTSGQFSVILPPVPTGSVISATATDAAGNTSEFALDAIARLQP
jgi:hypothetical protein